MTFKVVNDVHENIHHFRKIKFYCEIFVIQTSRKMLWIGLSKLYKPLSVLQQRELSKNAYFSRKMQFYEKKLKNFRKIKFYCEIFVIQTSRKMLWIGI